MKLNTVVCGGTFDHFHKGHEAFLNHALDLGNKVAIGLTSDSYVRSWKIETRNLNQIESFVKRKTSLLAFLKTKGVLDRAEIVEINDIFGQTLLKDFPIDTIVVSKDSKKGADIINRKRKELNLNLLKVFVVSSIKAEDGRLISSARIRNGEINRAGKLYVKPAWLKTDLVLPEDLKRKLKEPFGKLCQEADLKNELNSAYVITVGDVTSKKFNENSIQQNISVVDFRVARQEKFSSFSELGFLGSEKVITVNNPPGHITFDLFCAITKIFKTDFKNRIIVKVIGEEDLAVLPLILLSPLGTSIYYGQPDEGIVKIVISEDSKDKTYNLLSKFKPI
ncbi:MAG: pantetheine-phosphate adenylyltransferase [Candidatus Levybacteria bacterium]|nr:pantetheine-phosphate adenylyltransferase [Candidatus Levybacteria bacterium]